MVQLIRCTLLLFAFQCAYAKTLEIAPFTAATYFSQSSAELTISAMQSKSGFDIYQQDEKLGNIAIRLMLHKKPGKYSPPSFSIEPYRGSSVDFKENVTLTRRDDGKGFLLNCACGLQGELDLHVHNSVYELGGHTYNAMEVVASVDIYGVDKHSWWGVLSYNAAWISSQKGGSLWVMSPYGSDRGPLKKNLKSFIPQTIRNNKNVYAYGQSFNYFSYPERTHVDYLASRSHAWNRVSTTSKNYSSEYRALIDADENAPLRIVNTFSDTPGGVPSYLLWRQHIAKLQRTLLGLKSQTVLPIAGASVGSQIERVDTWEELAHKAVPVAKVLGFKRLWIGQNPTKGQQFPFEYDNEKATLDDLKKYQDIAEDSGIETVLWVSTATADLSAQLVEKNPQWCLVQASNRLAHYGGKEKLLIIHPWEDYVTWYLQQAQKLREETGIDGLWLDSFVHLLSSVDYREGYPKTGLPGALSLVEGLKNLGFSLYGEAETPLVIGSYWVRRDRYIDWSRREYFCAGSSPYTNRPDSTFLNYFAAASYGCLPIIDIHPYIDAKSVYDDQGEFAKLITHTNGILSYIDVIKGDKSIIVNGDEGVSIWALGKDLVVFFNEDFEKLKIKTRENYRIVNKWIYSGQEIALVTVNDGVTFLNASRYNAVHLTADYR